MAGDEGRTYAAPTVEGTLTARRYDRRPMAVAAAVVAALVVAGGVDYARTSAEVAEIGSGSDGFVRWYPLSEDLHMRSWIYATVALGAILAATAVAWRRSPPSARRDIFTDLGIGAVVMLLLALVFTLVAASASAQVSPPRQALVVVAAVTLVLAAVGTLATRPVSGRSASPRPEPPGAVAAALAYAPWIGLGLTATALILCGFVLTEGWDPCVDDEPGEIGPLITATGIAAIGAAICGAACLLRRRWVLALALLAVGPFVWLLAAVSTVCWN